MAYTTTIQPLNPATLELQSYSTSDTSLITNFDQLESFDVSKDYIEYTVYNLGNTLLNYIGQIQYKVVGPSITIDPEQDLIKYTFVGDFIPDGSYKTVYNILTGKIGSEGQSLYIDEISSDRTEIRLRSVTLDATTLIEATNKFTQERTTAEYYVDFYLNFGDNNLLIANNILLDVVDPSNPSILIKLYDPLPPIFDLKSSTWVVEKIADSIGYLISSTTVFEEQVTTTPLRGANFNLNLNNHTATPSTSTTYTAATTSSAMYGSGSLNYQLNNLLQNKGITINIDYSHYTNFIHFSSAQTRLENYYYKLQLIEQYQANAPIGTTTTTSSFVYYENLINDIISNFDGYEHYLYYTSASTAWPKATSEPPYVNYSTTSTEGQTWLADQLTIATDYDNQNKDLLIGFIPDFIRDNPANGEYELFVEMLGQHYDIIWTYTKDITNKYNADNRLTYGVSKDLLADILKDFGLKIYQNSFTTQNLYSAFLGITPEGQLLNIPGTTSTLPAATGLEYITDYVLASPTSSLVPLNDLEKEVYKRLYHNLPFLVRSKGTVSSIKTLANIYGIPDTILRINEFGGKDKTNVDDWDNWQHTYNNAAKFREGQVRTPARLYPDTAPSSIQFRFKTPTLTNLGLDQGSSGAYTLLTIGASSAAASALVLEYTGSGLTSGAYSGSAIDPYYQYGTLKWIPNIDTPYYSTSASIYLPFFNNEWWSIMVNLSSGSATSFQYATTSSLYAKQKGTYQGDNHIRYQGSSEVQQAQLPTAPWERITLHTTDIVSIGSQDYLFMNEILHQELRYYNTQVSESAFTDSTMNPFSIEGNLISGSQSSYNSLRFRASLGTDLLTSTNATASIHPSVTGSNVGTPTASFSDGTFTFEFENGLPDYTDNIEFIYQDQPNAGIQIAISDKIKTQQSILPVGNTLSPYISIQQNPAISQSYTRDVNYIEVAFSPQDEINDDIQEQLGFFNYGDYIGDPRLYSSSYTSYPDLDQLRDQYFQKYTKPYNLGAYFRLIKFFDNSLFKMVKDFVPARAGLAAGAVVKQHILERNRVQPPQMSWEEQDITGSVKSYNLWNPQLSQSYISTSKIYSFSGGTGGSLPDLTSFTSSGYYPPYVNISQSWDQVNITPSGSTIEVHNTLDEFFNGEFTGSSILVSDGNLTDEDCKIFLKPSTTVVTYTPVLYSYDITPQATFIQGANPDNGEIYIYYTEENVTSGESSQAGTPTQYAPPKGAVIVR